MKILSSYRVMGLAVLTMATIAFIAQPAAAAAAAAAPVGLAGWVTSLKGQFDAAMTVIGLIASVAGFASAGGCFFKLKEHNDNPNQIPLRKPLMLAFIAVCLIGLPEFLGIGVGSLFSSSTTLSNGNITINAIQAK
jgi:hypothetical protein